MKSRKALCAMVVILMTISAFAGCAASPTAAPSAQPTQAPAATTATAEATPATVDNSPKGDPITLSMFYGYAQPAQYPQDNDMFKWMTEQTGITLKVEYLVGDINTKIGVYLASGDYPDLIWGHEQHQKFIDAGAAIPLNDYINKFGDNVKKAYSEKELTNLTQPDGKIYFLNVNRSAVDNTYAIGGMYVQRKVLAEAGYPKIKTIEQYFALLNDYATKHPTTADGSKTIAFSAVADSENFSNLLMPITMAGGFTDDGYTAQIDPKTYEAHVFGRSEDAKFYWQQINKEYLTGNLDPETFTNNNEQWNAKRSTGRILGCFDWQWHIGNVQDSLKQQGKPEDMYVALPAMLHEGIVDRIQMPSAESVRDGTSISVNCKEPERAFKFLNWVLSEDVQKMNNWGEKGVDYLVDANGKFSRTPEIRAQLLTPDYKSKKGIGALGYPLPVNHGDAKYSDGNTWTPYFDVGEVSAVYDENDKKVLDAYGVKTYGEMFTIGSANKYGVAWDITYTDGSPEKIAEKAIYDLEMTYVPKLVMAADGQYDAVWTQFLAEFEKTNYQSVEKYLTEKVQARVAAAK